MGLPTCLVRHAAPLLGCAGLLLGAPALWAAEGGAGSYFGTDVGVNLAGDLNVPSGSVGLDTGVRWDIYTGYAFKIADKLTLAPEVELGIIYNPLKDASARGAHGSVSGSFFQVPVLINGVFSWQFSPNWVAYGGGGAGCDFMSLSVDSVGGRGFNTFSSETDFAWQGMAGIKYKFGSSEVGLGYKYLAVKPSGLETIGNNAISISYTFHF